MTARCWYCNVKCQKKHWKKHKKACKRRAAELRDEALFKDPPAKEECPICFLPMPTRLISCMALPPATISSVPIDDFAEANEVLASKSTEQYYSCCGKYICGGCMHSFRMSGNEETCPFCKTDRIGKTNEERVEERMRRVEVNDAGSMYVLGNDYYHGKLGLLQDRVRAMELWKQAAFSSHFSQRIKDIFQRCFNLLGGFVVRTKNLLACGCNFVRSSVASPPRWAS